MIGLGAGARSYTNDIHYSSDYAVGRGAIRSIIEDYSGQADFSKIRYGVQLLETEKRRRYVIKSILNKEGLDLARYQARFGSSALADLAELKTLTEANYLYQTATHLIPTRLGLERSDAVGPFLISSEIAETMQAYQWA